jgi:hypothetical protein
MTFQPDFFQLANFALIGLAFLLILFILVSMYVKIHRNSKYQKWKLMADLLIRKAIFAEEEADGAEIHVPTTSRFKKLLKNQYFRKVLINELINAKNAVSGSSADNLTQLYRQLNLQEFALIQLKNDKWYVKAPVIQELSIMGIKEHLTKVYRYTNNANELLRMEAQVAIVRFSGFEGLRFLDLVSYPISEWQQIKLLHELDQIPAENFSGIEKWIRSPNKTVVSFALKLARIHHRFELHDTIITCLTDDDGPVRLQAIHSLGEIYTEETAAILIGRILKEAPRQQMAIFQVLQNIASNDDIPVLLDQLDSDNIALKQAVARALAKISTEGFSSLTLHAHAGTYPLNEIIGEIKTELVA